MIFERKTSKVRFGDLKPGETFIYKEYGRLFVRAEDTQFDTNCFDLEMNRCHWFGNDILVTPVKVKIVEVE